MQVEKLAPLDDDVSKAVVEWWEDDGRGRIPDDLDHVKNLAAECRVLPPFAHHGKRPTRGVPATRQ
jgi:hypothetical protein